MDREDLIHPLAKEIILSTAVNHGCKVKAGLIESALLCSDRI